MAEARVKRQRALLGPGGPTYEVILDEFVICRLAVPVPVMRAQLQHLINLVSAEPRVTLVVLPYDAPVIGGLLPMSSFMLYTFTDPTDPPMALAETVNTDLVYSELAEVARYTRHYDRLWDAALSPTKSIAYLEAIADR